MGARRSRRGASADERPIDDIAILGVGHAPVGQVGPQLRRVRRRRRAGRARRRRRRVARRRSSSPAPTRCATATPATSPGATFAQALGWNGARVAVVVRRVRVGRHGARRPRGPRSSPGFCDVALVVGADTTPEGLPRARTGASAATTPTGCASGCSARPTRRTSRSTRAAAWSCTARPSDDFARVKVKNAPPRARRTRTRATARRSRSTTCSRRRSSPTRCACSTSAPRATARPRSSLTSAWTTPRRHGATDPVRVRGDLHGHADATRRPSIELPELRHRLPRRGRTRPSCRSRSRSPRAAYEEAGLGPDDLDVRRGLRPVDRARARLVREHRPVRRGEAEQLLRDGDTDDRRPHPGQPERRPGLLRRGRPGPGASPRCASSTWQLRGQAAGRQVEGARVGLIDQPGPLRPRLLGHRHPLILDPPTTRTGSDLCTPRSRTIATSSGFGAARSLLLLGPHRYVMLLIDISGCFYRQFCQSGSSARRERITDELATRRHRSGNGRSTGRGQDGSGHRPHRSRTVWAR